MSRGKILTHPRSNIAQDCSANFASSDPWWPARSQTRFRSTWYPAGGRPSRVAPTALYENGVSSFFSMRARSSSSVGRVSVNKLVLCHYPERVAKLHDPSLFNKDLAPIPMERRTWGLYNYVSLWVAMSVCIPTYMLASGLIAGGMSWWQAILTILLGNLIVLVPMLLNAHAGTRYGIPFPVFVRASFGVKGANVPAVLRALVACGWFGIQSWIGGQAIYSMLQVLWPAAAALPAGLWICFFAFWALNMYVIYRGIETDRKSTRLNSS